MVATAPLAIAALNNSRLRMTTPLINLVGLEWFLVGGDRKWGARKRQVTAAALSHVATQ
jgi:hypothetical protein